MSGCFTIQVDFILLVMNLYLFDYKIVFMNFFFGIFYFLCFYF